MNIINEYTFHHLRKNKRHTISIAIAITIATTLLCSLCIFVHTMWKAKVNETIKEQGYWHGELWESISGDQLKYITENPEVATTMIQGQWVTEKLPNTKRPYLLMRDGDRNFWKNMNLKHNLMEGRLPKKSGEIVVSKLFFMDNPSYKVGEHLKNYTIVGKLDVSGGSANPGYIAMGYLEHGQIQPKDQLTVYMKMVNPRKIYKTLPMIGKSVGFKKNEFGEYGVRYNDPLLKLYGIGNKENDDLQFMIILTTALIMVMLVMGAFVMIIYNGFSLSANSRRKQLGMLKSLGATPRQIRHSVIFEGLILCLPFLFIGIGLGYLFSHGVVFQINEILNEREGYQKIGISFSWYVVVFSALMSFVTVLISAYLPARKVAKVSPIEGIYKKEKLVKVKKQKTYRMIRKTFGMEGELAIAQFTANKRSFRVAVISLSMCFLLLSGYFTVMSIVNVAIGENDGDMKYDMSVDLNVAFEPDENMIKEITSWKEVTSSVVSRMVRTATYVEQGQETDIFAKAGGFDGVSKGKYNVLRRDGKYRIMVGLVGLGEESFKNYCETNGINGEVFGKKGAWNGILVDSTYHYFGNGEGVKKIPLLRVKEGEKLILEEKVEDHMKSNYKCSMQVAAVTEEYPCDLSLGRYRIALVVPMDTYGKVVKNFGSDRLLESQGVTISLSVGEENSQKVKKKLEQTCSSYLGSEDYSIWSFQEEKEQRELNERAISVSVFAIALLIGTIGIFNAFSTITNNMKLRRREFAMFRSVGVTPKGVGKILVLEGLFFGLTPILISLPVLGVISWFMLRVTYLSWSDFVGCFPMTRILIYVIVLVGTVWISYLWSGRAMKSGNIVGGIKDETM